MNSIFYFVYIYIVALVLAHVPMLLAVDALSDEDASAPPAPVSLPRKRRRLDANSVVVGRSDERRALRRVVDSNCFCKCKSKRKEHHNCFTPFQMPDTFDILLKLRMELRELSKSDHDLKAPRLDCLNLLVGLPDFQHREPQGPHLRRLP